jgi:hypothetical protein
MSEVCDVYEGAGALEGTTIPLADVVAPQIAYEKALTTIVPGPGTYPVEVTYPAVAPPSGGSVLEKIADNPGVIAALAEEGLEIDQDALQAAVQADKVAAELFVHGYKLTLEDQSDPVRAEVPDAPDDAPATTLAELKDQVNASFEEVASLLLDMNRRVEDIEARLEAYNKRGGHRI